MGGGLTAIFNAANEVCVDAFLNRSISFTEIVKVVEKVVSGFAKSAPFQIRDLADVSALENDARKVTAEIIKGA